MTSPPPADRLAAFVTTLEQAAETAAAAEHAFKAEALARGQALAAARAEAFRRLNFLKGLAGSLSAAPDGPEAVRAAQAYLRSRLDWEEMTPARTEVLDRLGPVALAVHGAISGAAQNEAPDTPAQASPVQDVAAEAGATQDPSLGDPSLALEAFEAWYSATRETPFWYLFEHYMPETPLVDF
ncbi:hypothetical protein [Aquabacter cavernae]|uniref:hypothetical protein n=1 Tax=Aquabacter cavernae TaxID=2496029 RepID=UPI000F8E8061|nr:hypothetical protein [Aquabacter cavernae]